MLGQLLSDFCSLGRRGNLEKDIIEGIQILSTEAEFEGPLRKAAAKMDKTLTDLLKWLGYKVQSSPQIGGPIGVHYPCFTAHVHVDYF